MAKFVKCTKCWREYFGYKCPNGCWDEKPKEIIQEVKTLVQPTVIIQDKKELKPIVVTKVEDTTQLEMFKWLPLYTSYYLNKKLRIDFNSIKQEKVCVHYKWKYILHTDIINQFKKSL